MNHDQLTKIWKIWSTAALKFQRSIFYIRIIPETAGINIQGIAISRSNLK